MVNRVEPRSVLDVEDLRARVQAVLDEVLDHQRKVVAEVSDDCLPLVDAVADLVAGGKRLRPAFCYWGWRGAGGDSGGDRAARVAAALELFQAAALLHDDVMDRSDTRRGRAAMHRAFTAMHRARGWAGDGEQFGNAAAILAGDLCLSWSDEVLSGAVQASELDDVQRRRVTGVFDRMRTQLMAGQYLDVLAQASGAGPSGADPVEAARRVIRFKSAKYTVEHPLLLGGTLAGAQPALLATYSAYGLPLGEAFQLRDDVLGVFGDPAQTGKPAGDDLREGKRTVLVALARARADATQGRLLADALGRADLDDDGVAAVRDVIARSGALEETERMIGSLAQQARAALDGADAGAGGPTGSARTVLLDLVETCTARTA